MQLKNNILGYDNMFNLTSTPSLNIHCFYAKMCFYVGGGHFVMIYSPAESKSTMGFAAPL